MGPPPPTGPSTYPPGPPGSSYPPAPSGSYPPGPPGSYPPAPSGSYPPGPSGSYPPAPSRTYPPSTQQAPGGYYVSNTQVYLVFGAMNTVYECSVVLFTYPCMPPPPLQLNYVLCGIMI